MRALNILGLVPLLVPLLVTTLLAPSDAAAQCAPTVLVPSVPLQIQWFGASVRADEDRLLVSAPTEDSQTGTIYAFLRDSGTGLWAETQRIQSSIRIPGMRFGRRIELDGDRFVASAQRAGTQFTGAVFVFEFDTSAQQWVERQVLTEPSATNYSKRMTLDDGLLAIKLDPLAVGDTAQVRFYRLDAVTGRFDDYGSIDSIQGVSSGGFGADIVFLDAETVLIGDSTATDAGIHSAGLVYLVELDPLTGVWSQASTISSNDPGQSNYFGAHLAWDGRQLLVSEPWDNQFVYGGGALLAFERDAGGTFVAVQELSPDRPTAATTVFGEPVALEDGQVWIRASIPDAMPRTTVIQRWLRDDRSGVWRQVGSLLDPLLDGITDFGLTADVEGEELFMGSPWTGVAANPQGRAYVYDLENCDLLGTRYCDPAPATSAGSSPRISAFGSSDVPDARLSLRATGLPAGTTALALGSQIAASSTPVGSAGPLCLGGSISRLSAPLVASAAGSVNLHLDVNAIPTAMGTTAVVPGDTWHFQVWFRDVTGTTTSGLTSAARITYF